MTGNTMIVSPEGGVSYINPNPAPPGGSVVGSYTLDGSSATITIPSTATVFNTKLIWAGVTGTTGNIVVLPSLNNAPITLTTPSGANYLVSPNLSQQQNLVITSNAAAYVNVADITNLVDTIPNGFYTVKALPSLPSFFAGWMLYITYRDTTEPFRNINIWSLLSQIYAGQSPVDISVSGFMTPSAGDVTGRMILAAGNGQPQLLGENVLFGISTSNLVTLSGPNNKINNFFASQINDNSGNLNKTGSFGNNNSIVGQNPINGDRTLWDITRIDASPGLTINQGSAIIRTTTSYDSYWICSVGLQVDVNAANLSPVIKTVDNSFTDIGETLTYTISFGNSGLIESFNTIVTDTIPSGVSFVPGSVIVNSVQSPSFNPQTGIMVGTVDAGTRVTITFNVTVTTIPSPNPILNTAEVGFTYSNSSGTGLIHDTTKSNIAASKVNHVDLGMVKYVDKAFAKVSDILTYIIPINAVGNTTAVNILFVDTIPNNTSLVAGTFTENGVGIIGSPNPPGVFIKNIEAGKVSTIVFKVIVNTIPSPNPIQNSATTIFSYTINPISIPNRLGNNSSNSNIVNTQINSANLGNITKYVDKAFANCGDILTYLVVIPNSGNVTAQNLVFIDTIPNGTDFVESSVYVNNILQLGAYPSGGITIPDLPPNNTATLTFKVKIQCQY